jgi:GTP-binding protein
LQRAVQKHPPAGLKNTFPRLRYVVQTDVSPQWFVIHGSNLKFLHWSYKRYLERNWREAFDFAGTPIKFSFIDEHQVNDNKARIAEGKEPINKAKAKNEAEALAEKERIIARDLAKKAKEEKTKASEKK